MEIITTTAAEIWKVALGALILGAGLPIVFSLGLKSLYGTRQAVVAGGNGTQASTQAGRPTAAGMLGAIICFAVVVAAILFGVVVLIWGKQMFGK